MSRRNFLARTSWGLFAVATAGCGARAESSHTTEDVYLNIDFDTSETQALTHPWSAFQVAQPHQHAWIEDLTRSGRGHAERFEIHDDSGDVVNGQAYRSMMDVLDTNDGGRTSGPVVGFADVFWSLSCYWPTASATPDHATVTPGNAQVAAPAYEMFFELHERSNVNGTTRGVDDVQQVSLLSLMVRDGQLQFRSCAGRFVFRDGTWRTPEWSRGSAGTTGRNDRIPVPIVKPSGTDPDLVTDVWLDIVMHVRFREGSGGLVELWARQSGSEFSDAPTVRVSGPTHRVLVGLDGRTRSSADLDPQTGTTGVYMHCGLYTGSASWEDPVNAAHVVVLDEIRRYGSLVEAKANWDRVR